MPATVVVGAQWGDEGKGKVTDHLADKMHFVVRYQGGNNAGHTVIQDTKVLKLHLLPSGIMYPHITSVIGSGVVIDPAVLIDEIEMVKREGIKQGPLVLSSNAHLIMPYHKMLDAAQEVKLGKAQIGTTGRGIGPAYADKSARVGIRLQDLLDEKIMKKKLEAALKVKNPLLEKMYGMEPLSASELVKEFRVYAEKLTNYIADTSELLNRALDKKKNVLLEGAQGTMLDLDHGTYPFVTSSSPIAGGACVGAGISPLRIDHIIAIAKAYTTRVGHGPFPTEDCDSVGEKMREVGGEFGTTTGRARRCGWLDLVVLAYAHRLNHFTSIALTKLDVLSTFKKIKVCVGYEYNEDIIEKFPIHQSIFHKVTPIYEELDGWMEDISDIRDLTKLPKQTKNYVRFIEKYLKVPISLISVGPSREQTIIKKRLA